MESVLYKSAWEPNYDGKSNWFHVKFWTYLLLNVACEWWRMALEFFSNSLFGAADKRKFEYLAWWRNLLHWIKQLNGIYTGSVTSNQPRSQGFVSLDQTRQQYNLPYLSYYCQLRSFTIEVIDQTLGRVFHQDIQTPRSVLKNEAVGRVF